MSKNITEVVENTIEEVKEAVEPKETLVQKVKGFFKKNGKKIVKGVLIILGGLTCAAGGYALGANGGLEFLSESTDLNNDDNNVKE